MKHLAPIAAVAFWTAALWLIVWAGWLRPFAATFAILLVLSVTTAAITAAIQWARRNGHL